jgi:hypothetical protein
MTKAERTAWKNIVIRQLKQLQDSVNQPITFVILAGKKYRTPFESFDHVVPMQGLGIGKQLKWLTDANTMIEQFTCTQCKKMVSWDKGCHHEERPWSVVVDVDNEVEQAMEIELSTWDAEYDIFDQLTRNGEDILSEDQRINIQNWVQLMQLENKKEGKFRITGMMTLLLFNQLERFDQEKIIEGMWTVENLELCVIHTVGEKEEYSGTLLQVHPKGLQAKLYFQHTTNLQKMHFDAWQSVNQDELYKYAKKLWKAYQTKIIKQAKELNHDK